MAELSQASHMLRVTTRGKGFFDITEDLRRWLGSISAGDGLLTVFVCHTSASLTIQENADPNVPSHIKAMLTEVSLGIPVMGGRMVLGTWQGVYLIEHRAAPHERNIALNFIGSSQSSS